MGVLRSVPRNKVLPGTKTMHNNGSSVGGNSAGANVSLTSPFPVSASQNIRDCLDITPQLNNDPVVRSDAPAANATNNASADEPACPSNSSCKFPQSRADVVTTGGQKGIVRKTAPATMISSTTFSTDQSIAKARYGALNLVMKPEQKQRTPADVKEYSPATFRFNNTVDAKEYTAAEDARIMEVVTSVLQNGSKTNNAWDNLATELSRDVLSLKSRWLQIFKTKRNLDQSSSKLASSYGLQPSSVVEDSVPQMPATSIRATPANPALPDSVDVNTLSKPTSTDKNNSKTADVTSPTLSLNSTRYYEMSSNTSSRLAMSPLQSDRAVNPTRVVVFPSRENFHDAFMEFESGEYS